MFNCVKALHSQYQTAMDAGDKDLLVGLSEEVEDLAGGFSEELVRILGEHPPAAIAAEPPRDPN